MKIQLLYFIFFNDFQVIPLNNKKVIFELKAMFQYVQLDTPCQMLLFCIWQHHHLIKTSFKHYQTITKLEKSWLGACSKCPLSLHSLSFSHFNIYVRCKHVIKLNDFTQTNMFWLKYTQQRPFFHEHHIMWMIWCCLYY